MKAVHALTYIPWEEDVIVIPANVVIPDCVSEGVAANGPDVVIGFMGEIISVIVYYSDILMGFNIPLTRGEYKGILGIGIIDK